MTENQIRTFVLQSAGKTGRFGAPDSYAGPHSPLPPSELFAVQKVLDELRSQGMIAADGTLTASGALAAFDAMLAANRGVLQTTAPTLTPRD